MSESSQTDSPVRSRAILALRYGPHRAQRVIIDPGTSLMVGRTDRSDLVIARDERLSGVHFRLDWDGAHGTLEDVNSAEGTEVDGQPAEGPTRVSHGSWIRAGGCVFSLYHEGGTPPRSPGGAEPPPSPNGAAPTAHVGDSDLRHSESLRARALQELRPRLGHLYAVLDAARDERIPQLVREAVDESRSLYEGPRGEALADVAPYLVRLRSDSGLLERLVREGWGRSWGVFFDSAVRFESMRRHLRRYLMVEAESTGERLYFRYYDPRVLRDFLPLATPRQLALLLADIDEVLFEDDAGGLARFEVPQAVGAEASDPREPTGP